MNVYEPVPLNILTKAYIFDVSIRKLKGGWAQSDYKNKYSHGISKIGEYVFAKSFGLIDSINWAVQKSGDGKSDFVVNGKTIDVKTTTYTRHPELKCLPQENNAEFYVLAAYNVKPHRTAKLVGWIHNKDLFCDANFSDYRGLGYRYWVKSRKLNTNFEQLKHELTAVHPIVDNPF